MQPCDCEEELNLKRSLPFLLLLILLCSLYLPQGASAQHPCDPPNILFNCNFDTFTRVGSNKEIPQGWWFFLEDGDPAYDQSIDTAFGAPALRIWSDGGSFTAGIYQEVPDVTPGVAYRARIGWAASSVPAMERKLGIDPFGGTDSRSPHVVWGPSCWDQTRMPDLSVSVVAQASKITVFLRVHHSQSFGADQVFLDAISLVVDPDQPEPTSTSTPPPPTATPAPPTATPMPSDTATPLPTETPTPSPSPAPTDTGTPTPTSSPSPTPTLTPTGTPTGTSTPTDTVTWTPAPTATPTSTPTPTPALPRPFSWALGTMSTDTLANLFLGFGIFGFAGATILTGVLVWMSRRHRED